MPNVAVRPMKSLTAFRRTAMGTWGEAGDPQAYGTMSVRMEAANEYIEAFRRETGQRLTVTHLVAKALAQALHDLPEANAIMRFGKPYYRESVTISLLVLQNDGPGKVDLAAATLRDADKLSLAEVARFAERNINDVRGRKDKQMEDGKALTNRIPVPLMRRFLKVISFLMYGLNLNLKRFGVPRDPFGGATITNIGPLGLDAAHPPLVPYTRTPIVLTVGAVHEAPVVENGRVVVGQVMNMGATLDHRFIDAYHASVLAKTLRDHLEHPFERFGAIPKRLMAAA
jgi:pyruvate dehydrogenase E2 component (dihydrolipoamide acetyltransferase)